MNSSRCSELGAVLACLALLAVAVVPAAAVSVSGETPDTAQVGAQQSTTFTVTDPFSEYEEWTLRATTDLTNVTWQVMTFDNAGNQVNEETLTGQSMNYTLQASTGVVRVEVSLVGTTPGPEAFEWSYDPAQNITYAQFVQAQEGGSSTVLTTYDTRPYTGASQSAREAIQAAEQAIQNARQAGGGVGDAENYLENAIEFYNGGQFEQATQNANNAEQSASNAASSARRTDLLLMVGAGVVVLLLVAGGVYWYLQQRDTYDKLS